MTPTEIIDKLQLLQSEHCAGDKEVQSLIAQMVEMVERVPVENLERAFLSALTTHQKVCAAAESSPTVAGTMIVVWLEVGMSKVTQMVIDRLKFAQEMNNASK